MALTQIMGDFPDAVRVSSEVLKIAGRIYPSTTANVALEATLADGAKVVGETRISRSREAHPAPAPDSGHRQTAAGSPDRASRKPT